MSFAEPILAEMADWPAAQSWGDWLRALERLAPRVIAKPERVLRMLRELAPLSAIGPVSLREVRDVLTPRLSTLTHEPPRRRHGRVFVGTPTRRARPIVPGRVRARPCRADVPAEAFAKTRCCPIAAAKRPTRRSPRRPRRAADERLQLTLAVGAAAERLYVSYPRIELNESRQRVPSFYVLDIARAIEGHIPPASMLAARASEAGGATLAWPAPLDAGDRDRRLRARPGDDGGAAAERDRTASKGRARYLYELSPELQRSLSSRWLRWHRKQWEPADGIVRSTDDDACRRSPRSAWARGPYSLTALQRYSACPYQFLMAAVYRLAPLEAPAPLQKMDPLTRGDLFHQMQAAALRRLQADGLLPLSPDTLPAAQQRLTAAIKEVHDREYDRLNPAIDRVWQRRDRGDDAGPARTGSRSWPKKARSGRPSGSSSPSACPTWTAATSTARRTPALVDGRFQLRGSIDMIERHRQTRLPARHRSQDRQEPHQDGQTIVDGGRVLQPVVYGLALEGAVPERDGLLRPPVLLHDAPAASSRTRSR